MTGRRNCDRMLVLKVKIVKQTKERGKEMKDGTVQYPYYKNGGKYHKPGLRNKRKSYWNKIRQAELREELKRSRAAQRENREAEFHFEDVYTNSQTGHSENRS